jgi:hypothetical protein
MTLVGIAPRAKTGRSLQRFRAGPASSIRPGNHPPEGIEAPLVDIGLGREIDLRGRTCAERSPSSTAFPLRARFLTAFGTADRLA